MTGWVEENMYSEEDFFTDDYLDEHILKLREGRDVSPIPLMMRSAMTDYVPDFSEIIGLLPKCVRGSGDEVIGEQNGVRTGRARARSRGRASRLKERARQVREKGLMMAPRSTTPDSSLTGTGSEDFDGYSLSSFGAHGFNSDFHPHQMPYSDPPHASLSPQPTASTASLVRMDQGSEVGQFDDAEGGLLEYQEPVMNIQQEEAEVIAKSQGTNGNQNTRKKSKKIKYTKLDLSEPYEEDESELLIGVPAGMETSVKSAYCTAEGSSGFVFHDFLPTVSDHKGYIPDVRQKEPKTQSVIDFPTLPKEVKSNSIRNESLNLSSQTPTKKNSMKAIASFVTSSDRDRSDDENVNKEEDFSANKTINQGPVLVIENVPAAVCKNAVRDLVENYGPVTNLRTERLGNGYTAYLSMYDSDIAQWVAECLDESDTFLTGEEGTPLHVHIVPL